MKIKAIKIPKAKIKKGETIGDFQKRIQGGSIDPIKQGLYKVELLTNAGDWKGARAEIETWDKNSPYYKMQDGMLKRFGY